MKRILLFIVLLFVAAVVYAAEAEQNVVGGAVVGFLEAVVWPFLSALGVGLVGVLLAWMRKKWNVQISETQQAKIESLVLTGIVMAEEKAAGHIKRKVKQFTGKEKLDFVLAKVLEAAPDVSREQADKLVHDLLDRLKAEKNAPKG